jgi:membrane protease YdiL (CAAX protease family)
MPARAFIGFAVLAVAYQLPEGVGQRLLHSFAAQAALLILFFPAAYLVGRALSSTPARAYGLEWTADAARWLPATFVVAVLIKLGSAFAGVRGHVYAPAAASAAAWTALLTGLLVTFLPSLAEDIVTRGFWLRSAGIRWPTWPFVLASSVIYVANHIYRLHLGAGEWTMLFAFGLAYALAAVRFNSLWPAVGLHWGWNYGNLVVEVIRPIETIDPTGARVLSIGAHLLMAALVLLATVQRPREPDVHG